VSAGNAWPAGGSLRAAGCIVAAAMLCACAAAPQEAPGGFLALRAVVYPAAQAGTARWYAELLGTSPQTPILGSAAFAIGHSQLDLDAAAPSPLAIWQVANIEEAFQRLLAHGAEAVTGIQEIGALHVAVFRDPFGNLLGIVDGDAAAR
jgi:Glyoxalase/Bleomycin resistance protein/Dioxygenase superfamily